MTVPVARIQAETAKVFKVSGDVMTAPLARGLGKVNRNTHPVAHARQVAMYLTRVINEYSYPQIGRLFGGRDHSTVLYAVREIEERLEHSRILAEKVRKIEIELAKIPETVIIEAPEPDPIPASRNDRVAPKVGPVARKRDPEEERILRNRWDMMRQIAFDPPVRVEDRVYRDPCFKCGVRGDIGCVHTRVAA